MKLKDLFYHLFSNHNTSFYLKTCKYTFIIFINLVILSRRNAASFHFLFYTLAFLTDNLTSPSSCFPTIHLLLSFVLSLLSHRMHHRHVYEYSREHNEKMISRGRITFLSFLYIVLEFFIKICYF
jgi:hypothetical protein